MVSRKSKHSKVRIQQRGFNKSLVEFILEHGKQTRAKGNAFKVQCGKQVCDKLLKCKNVSDEIKAFIKSNYERLVKKVLVVASDGTMITAYNKN